MKKNDGRWFTNIRSGYITARKSVSTIPTKFNWVSSISPELSQKTDLHMILEHSIVH